MLFKEAVTQIIEAHTVNVIKFHTLCSIFVWPKFCFFTQLLLKIPCTMAKSVDLDHDQPDLGLLRLHIILLDILVYVI